MKTFAARVVWNTKGWKHPSGEHGEKNGTYASDNGFGHEEWLGRDEWLIDGFRYSRLQPLAVKHKNFQPGETAKVFLYAVKPEPKRTFYYVGLIDECELLSETQAEEAKQVFTQRGWLEAMIKVTGGDKSPIHRESAPNLFNIRFRKNALHWFDSTVQMKDDDSLAKSNRYILRPISDDPGTRQSARRIMRRVGSHLKDAKTSVVRYSKEYVCESLQEHVRIQKALLRKLIAQHGKDRVIAEQNFVDITVTRDDGLEIWEIKAYNNASMAIRDSIGQLLAYTSRAMTNGKTVRGLVIAAPAKLDEQANQLLTFFQVTIPSLPIRYEPVSE